MGHAVCSCGQAVPVNGVDSTDLERLIDAVRAARYGVLSGEVSGLEGLQEVEAVLNGILHGLHCDVSESHHSGHRYSPASAGRFGVCA